MTRAPYQRRRDSPLWRALLPAWLHSEIRLERRLRVAHFVQREWDMLGGERGAVSGAEGEVRCGKRL